MKCSAPYCRNSRRRCPDLSFLVFPKTLTGNFRSAVLTSLLVCSCGQLVVWLRFRPMDRRVAGSMPYSTNFLTNSSGQATNGSNALVYLFTKQ